MKDPLNAGIHISTSPLAQCRSFQNSSPKGFGTDGTADTFISLMANIIEKGKRPDIPDNPLALNKDRLQEMIYAVTIQMNDYMLNELSDFDEDAQDVGIFESQRRWMDAYGAGHDAPSLVSNIDQKPQNTTNSISKSEINKIIKHASNIYGVSPKLITAVVRAESDFDTGAISRKGAKGLMQLMPETAKELGVKNCYNPVENIMAGTRYLKNLLNRYDGNIELTLAAYNWGMGNVESQSGELPRETRNYIARVNRFLQKETL
jgi:hypothetical protein